LKSQKYILHARYHLLKLDFSTEILASEFKHSDLKLGFLIFELS